MIVPFSRFGESADDELVTTIVHSLGLTDLDRVGRAVLGLRPRQAGTGWSWPKADAVACCPRTGVRRCHRVHQRITVAGQDSASQCCRRALGPEPTKQRTEPLMLP